MYIAVDSEGIAYFGKTIEEAQNQLADVGSADRPSALRWFKAEEGEVESTFVAIKKLAAVKKK